MGVKASPRAAARGFPWLGRAGRRVSAAWRAGRSALSRLSGLSAGAVGGDPDDGWEQAALALFDAGVVVAQAAGELLACGVRGVPMQKHSPVSCAGGNAHQGVGVRP